jgi:hypothetical protein
MPLLLLLLIGGQMSAEFCRAQCEGRMLTAHACGMHGMAHAHCASCKHASANSTNASLSTPKTCSGQTCNSILELVQVRTDPEVRPLVVAVSFDILAPSVLEDTHPARFRNGRSTRSIPPFDPLISGLRI